MNAQELQAAVDNEVWYHKIDLPHGIQTAGWAPLDASLYKLPDDLTGKRVLDVGAWDGYWTFEALKRGAAEVVAIENFTDTIYENEQRSWHTFHLCREALGYSREQAKTLEMSVYDVTPARLGHFDVVLFFGVLYHCRHPLLALDQLATVTNERICIESAVCDDFSPYRYSVKEKTNGGYKDGVVMEFYPKDQLGQNVTNWWAPTTECLREMVLAAGFKRAESWKWPKPQHLKECRGFVHGFMTE